MSKTLHHRLLIGFFLLGITFTTPVLRAQGDAGFLRGAGRTDLSFSYSEDYYDRFWIGTESVEDAPFGEVVRHTANVNVAYGLREDMDLTINGSFVYVTTDAVFDKEEDLQDLTLQWKWRFWSKNTASGRLNLLFAPAIKTPFTDYEDNAVPAIGDGQTDLRLRGILQYVWHDGTYLALETGYDFRFDEPGNEFPFHLMGGTTFADRVTLSGFASRMDSRDGYDIGAGPFPGVEEDYTRAGLHLYGRLTERFGVAASAWTTLDGRNTGDVDGFSIGVVLRF